MKIVFIHGRSQDQSQHHKDPDKLKKDWTKAMLTGLKKIGPKSPQSSDILFPYYGEQLFKDTEGITQKRFHELLDKGDNAPLPGSEEEQFIRELVFEIAARQGISHQQIAEETTGELVDKGIQNWRSVLAALRLLDHVPSIASASIELITRDVWCYLTNVGARRTVNSIVDDAIPKTEPCIIVAHSLGTIVAYNVLMDRHDRSNIRKLITVGSPLGIEAVLQRLPSDSPPRKAPAGVPYWFNARDERDVVALYEIPAARYHGSPIVTNYNGVRNTSNNRHGIREYLMDPVVAKAIYDEL
ncbi:alpha/beta fold hydrolase [Brenneria uluponensis]|uniref:alpha/beta fold hydrolase n=1 Tax=Brenneria uluponensis TaxID=3057057 RepID=UPI0028E21BF4|nr:hypothetical protein [Brenneria ulupoensis]